MVISFVMIIFNNRVFRRKELCHKISYVNAFSVSFAKVVCTFAAPLKK